MILFGPPAIEGYYFVTNLVTKSSSSLFCSEQVEVGIISLTIDFLLLFDCLWTAFPNQLCCERTAFTDYLWHFKLFDADFVIM
jgi:hypothetical protein